MTEDLLSPFDAGIDGWRVGHPSASGRGRSLRQMSAEEISITVASKLAAAISRRLETHRHFVLAPSAGRTFQHTYSVLREQHHRSVDWTRVVCVQMDEYVNIGCRDRRSFASQLFEELIAPLRIAKFVTFLDDAGLPRTSLDGYDAEINDLGGIDCCLHGVGRNGHVGLNEPQDTYPARTRLVTLAEATRLANGVQFRDAMTLGMDTLRAARASIVVMLGKAKRAAARDLLVGVESPRSPVTYLRGLPEVAVFLDENAWPFIAEPSGKEGIAIRPAPDCAPRTPPGASKDTAWSPRSPRPAS